MGLTFLPPALEGWTEELMDEREVWQGLEPALRLMLPAWHSP